jgi:hypothetical protein
LLTKLGYSKLDYSSVAFELSLTMSDFLIATIVVLEISVVFFVLRLFYVVDLD